jgi:hypothetical protein
MEISSMLRGEAPKRMLQGALIGAAATMLIGFNWGGWVLGGTAQDMAQKSASTAVVAALVPICVEQFQQGSDAPAKLVELKKISSWEQSAYIEKGGWSAMPGGKAANVSGLSQACALALRDLK